MVNQPPVKLFNRGRETEMRDVVDVVWPAGRRYRQRAHAGRGPPDASIFRSRQPRRAAPPAPPGALSAVDGLV